MNSEKKGAAIGKALLSGPYLLWMAGFTLIPLAMIVWYGLTDKGGSLTMSNIIAIASPDHAKALWLSLGLSLISTVLCLLLAYPLAMILRGRGAAASAFFLASSSLRFISASIFFIWSSWALMSALYWSISDWADAILEL